MVANQAARASAFIVSIDDEEINEEGPESVAIQDLRAFIRETRRRNADIPIFLFGETRTSQHIPNEILKELHGFIHMFEDTPEDFSNSVWVPRATIRPLSMTKI